MREQTESKSTKFIQENKETPYYVATKGIDRCDFTLRTQSSGTTDRLRNTKATAAAVSLSASSTYQ